MNDPRQMVPQHLVETPSVLEDLSVEECLKLLGTMHLGRLAVTRPSGPIIIPVNYVWSAGRVIFRTSPRNAWATALRHGAAAFEVEDINEITHSGWTVLVQGDSRYLQVTDDDNGDLQSLRPWAAGDRPLHIAITPSSITGRRLRPQWWLQAQAAQTNG
jgi:uncharacterized protein